MYPHEATAGFTLNIWHNPRDVSRRNTATMEALLSGVAYRDPVWRDLVAGSRAEGLGLEEGWGHEPADNDIMSLHGQSWGVHIPDDKDASLINDAEPTESEGESFLEMVDAETPCFCRVKVNGRLQDLVNRIGQGIAHGTKTPEEIKDNTHLVVGFAVALAMKPRLALFSFVLGLSLWSLFARYCNPGGHATIYHKNTADSYHQMDAFRHRLPDMISSYWSIGREKVMECFCLRNNIQYLSSVNVLRLLSDPRHSQIHQGPSQMVGQWDMVPALVCSRPFPCIYEKNGYLSRSRYYGWPTSEALADIAVLPGVIVATGNTNSPADERDQGYPSSPQELCLSRDTPDREIAPSVIPESENHELEWRYSFSSQELRLSRDMPEWVKTGYLAAKYTFKSVCKRQLSDLRRKSSRFADARCKVRELLGHAWKQFSCDVWNRNLPGRKNVLSFWCSYFSRNWTIIWQREYFLITLTRVVICYTLSSERNEILHVLVFRKSFVTQRTPW